MIGAPVTAGLISVPAKTIFNSSDELVINIY